MSSFFEYIDTATVYETWAFVAILGCVIWVLVTTIRMIQDNSRANREFRDWTTARISSHTKQHDHIAKAMALVIEGQETFEAKCAKSFIEVTDLIQQLNEVAKSHELQLQATKPRPPVTYTCNECPERSTSPFKDGWFKGFAGEGWVCPRCVE